MTKISGWSQSERYLTFSSNHTFSFHCSCCFYSFISLIHALKQTYKNTPAFESLSSTIFHQTQNFLVITSSTFTRDEKRCICVCGDTWLQQSCILVNISSFHFRPFPQSPTLENTQKSVEKSLHPNHYIMYTYYDEYYIYIYSRTMIKHQRAIGDILNLKVGTLMLPENDGIF